MRLAEFYKSQVTGSVVTDWVDQTFGVDSQAAAQQTGLQNLSLSDLSTADQQKKAVQQVYKGFAATALTNPAVQEQVTAEGTQLLIQKYLPYAILAAIGIAIVANH